MKLSIREKKVLYAFGCPNYQNTVTRDEMAHGAYR